MRVVCFRVSLETWLGQARSGHTPQIPVAAMKSGRDNLRRDRPDREWLGHFQAFSLGQSQARKRALPSRTRDWLKPMSLMMSAMAI